MDLHITTAGEVRCVYNEAIDLAGLGSIHITRASHVEPTTDGHWQADLSPVNGPILGPFPRRSQALDAEQTWLQQHWLMPTRKAS